MNTDKKCCESWQRNYEVDIIQHKKNPLLVCTDFSLNALHLLNIIEIYCQNIIPFFFFCWQLNTLRGSILEDAVPSTSKHGLARGLPLKEVLEYLVPELNAHCLRLALNTPKVTEQLMKLDEQGVRRGSTCRLEWSSVSFWWRNWKIERKKKEKPLVKVTVGGSVVLHPPPDPNPLMLFTVFFSISLIFPVSKITKMYLSEFI